MSCVLIFGIILLITLIVSAITICNNNIESFESDVVDVVYTWVNSNDSEWLKQKESYYKILENDEKLNSDNSKRRWVNTLRPFDEVTLSIESVRKYLPWVRNIFVVTQRPQTLPKEFIEKFNVKIVFHDQIFKNKSVLPVFSSHAIEANIHRIPKLSENFIYFNDDMYINLPMNKEDFFINDKPIIRNDKKLEIYYNYISRIYLINDAHCSSIIYMKKLLNKNITIPIHQALPISKKMILYTENKFSKQWNLTNNNKFRTHDTIIPMYLTVNSVEKKMHHLTNDRIKTFFFIDNFNSFLGNIYNNCHMICVNNLTADNMQELRDYVLND
jgi:hypothetical protein